MERIAPTHTIPWDNQLPMLMVITDMVTITMQAMLMVTTAIITLPLHHAVLAKSLPQAELHAQLAHLIPELKTAILDVQEIHVELINHSKPMELAERHTMQHTLTEAHIIATTHTTDHHITLELPAQATATMDTLTELPVTPDRLDLLIHTIAMIAQPTLELLVTIQAALQINAKALILSLFQMVLAECAQQERFQIQKKEVALQPHQQKLQLPQNQLLKNHLPKHHQSSKNHPPKHHQSSKMLCQIVQPTKCWLEEFVKFVQHSQKVKLIILIVLMMSAVQDQFKPMMVYVLHADKEPNQIMLLEHAFQIQFTMSTNHIVLQTKFWTIIMDVLHAQLEPMLMHQEEIATIEQDQEFTSLLSESQWTKRKLRNHPTPLPSLLPWDLFFFSYLSQLVRSSTKTRNFTSNNQKKLTLKTVKSPSQTTEFQLIQLLLNQQLKLKKLKSLPTKEMNEELSFSFDLILKEKA